MGALSTPCGGARSSATSFARSAGIATPTAFSTSYTVACAKAPRRSSSHSCPARPATCCPCARRAGSRARPARSRSSTRRRPLGRCGSMSRISGRTRWLPSATSGCTDRLRPAASGCAISRSSVRPASVGARVSSFRPGAAITTPTPLGSRRVRWTSPRSWVCGRRSSCTACWGHGFPTASAPCAAVSSSGSAICRSLCVRRPRRQRASSSSNRAAAMSPRWYKGCGTRSASW